MYLTSCREKLLKIKKKKATVKTAVVGKSSAARRPRRRPRPVRKTPKLAEIEVRDFETIL